MSRHPKKKIFENEKKETEIPMQHGTLEPLLVYAEQKMHLWCKCIYPLGSSGSLQDKPTGLKLVTVHTEYVCNTMPGSTFHFRKQTKSFLMFSRTQQWRSEGSMCVTLLCRWPESEYASPQPWPVCAGGLVRHEFVMGIYRLGVVDICKSNSQDLWHMQMV